MSFYAITYVRVESPSTSEANLVPILTKKSLKDSAIRLLSDKVAISSIFNKRILLQFLFLLDRLLTNFQLHPRSLDCAQSSILLQKKTLFWPCGFLN